MLLVPLHQAYTSVVLHPYAPLSLLGKDFSTKGPPLCCGLDFIFCMLRVLIISLPFNTSFYTEPFSIHL